ILIEHFIEDSYSYGSAFRCIEVVVDAVSANIHWGCLGGHVDHRLRTSGSLNGSAGGSSSPDNEGRYFPRIRRPRISRPGRGKRGGRAVLSGRRLAGRVIGKRWRYGKERPGAGEP